VYSLRLRLLLDAQEKELAREGGTPPDPLLLEPLQSLEALTGYVQASSRALIQVLEVERNANGAQSQGANSAGVPDGLGHRLTLPLWSRVISFNDLDDVKKHDIIINDIFFLFTHAALHIPGAENTRITEKDSQRSLAEVVWSTDPAPTGASTMASIRGGQ